MSIENTSMFAIAKEFNDSKIVTTSKENGSYIYIYVIVEDTKGPFVIRRYCKVEVNKYLASDPDIKKQIGYITLCEWDVYDIDVIYEGMKLHTITFKESLEKTGLYEVVRDFNQLLDRELSEEEMRKIVYGHPDCLKLYSEDLRSREEALEILEEMKKEKENAE